MNHLAHFLLCPDDDGLRAGTLMADFARGTDLSAFAAPVEQGIRLHRRVDALVDQSPHVDGLKPLVGAPLRRYAGILLDVFFDYALIQQWPAISSQPRPDFTSGVYAALEREEPRMPAAVRAVSARMRTHDALASCTTHEGCMRTLTRIATRLKRPVELAAGIETLVRHEAQIVNTFAQLLPMLRIGAQNYLEGSSLNTRPLELSVSR